MKIVIPGGTGQVGTVLARHFHATGHEVVVLSRRTSQTPWRQVMWDGRALGDWLDEFDGADAVINLAGRSVNCRYTRANRKSIMASRVDSTRIVGRAIAACRTPPRVWLQASTATIYAHRYDAANDETTGILGGAEATAPATWKFSIDVAKAWEAALDEAETPFTRKVKLRSAMTMSPDAGGIFDTLLRLVRFGCGGRAADGRQYISWVHHIDFVRAIRFLIDHDELSGAINIAAPEPFPNAEFMGVLCDAWGARYRLPAPRIALPIAAWLMRTETELILKSRRVVAGRLAEAGFYFDFPRWRGAAQNLCNEWCAARRSARQRQPLAARVYSTG